MRSNNGTMNTNGEHEPPAEDPARVGVHAESPRLQRCLLPIGRVKLENEAFNLGVPMLDLERLSECITCIDVSLVERRRTPG